MPSAAREERPVASTYDIGDIVRCAVVFTLVDGSTADPTKAPGYRPGVAPPSRDW